MLHHIYYYSPVKQMGGCVFLVRHCNRFEDTVYLIELQHSDIQQEL